MMQICPPAAEVFRSVASHMKSSDRSLRSKTLFPEILHRCFLRLPLSLLAVNKENVLLRIKTSLIEVFCRLLLPCCCLLSLRMFVTPPLDSTTRIKGLDCSVTGGLAIDVAVEKWTRRTVQ
nr:hypothetical protein Iba_chr06aCG15010 [Ipomoea batatas]